MNNFDNFVNGRWVASETYNKNINPSDLTDVVGQYAQGDDNLVELAVSSAKQAFAKWSKSNIQARADILEKIGTEIIKHSQKLAELLAREEGKPVAESIGEVCRAGNIFKFYAGECLRLAGQTVPSVRPGIGIEVTREPLGVIGLITPWNFPIAIPAWKIAPALAYGNCVVFKPAELVPGSAWLLSEIIANSGLPDGVFNLVMGPGKTVGDAIINNKDVEAISFTGSVATGKRIAEVCQSNQTKVQLEMGGKNPQIVLDDADLELAANLCIQSAFYSTGQRCTASSRIIVTEGIHDRFVELLVYKMKNLTVGPALSKGTDIGPVASEAQLKQNLSYIKIGIEEGATLVYGGEKLALETEGYYMRPALFVDTISNMRINREEIFGPIATIIRVADYTQALEVANDTEFGLSAGIATSSLKEATHFKQHANAGMVMVNLPTAGVDYHVPFGGVKGSSYGPREQGTYAAEFYTRVKTAYTFA